MQKVFLVALFYLSIFSVQSQQIKSPSEFLGYELGTRFSHHHQVVDYYKYIASTLSYVQLQKYGETNEHRDLYIAIVSSQENIHFLTTVGYYFVCYVVNLVNLNIILQ